MTTQQLAPTVTLTNGIPTTTSLDIAERFGKLHKDVIRKITTLKNEVSDDFGQRNFTPSSYPNEQNKMQPMFIVARDGFTILAMGFTGKRAMEWKIKYIEAFNQMEAELRKSQPLPNINVANLVKVTVNPPKAEMPKLPPPRAEGPRLLKVRQYAARLGIKPDRTLFTAVGTLARRISDKYGSPYRRMGNVTAFTPEVLREAFEKLARQPARISLFPSSQKESGRTIRLLDSLWKQLDEQAAKAGEPWDVQILRIIGEHFSAKLAPKFDYPASRFYTPHERNTPRMALSSDGHLHLTLMHFILAGRYSPIQETIRKLKAQGHEVGGLEMELKGLEHYVKAYWNLLRRKEETFDTGVRMTGQPGK